MNFHSAEYVLLLALVFLSAVLLPSRFRNPLLLAASVVFYMWWRPEYVLLILFSVAVDYGVARGLKPDAPLGRRRLLLAVSLASNLGLLFFFKYFGLAADSLRALLGMLGRPWTPPVLEVVLPVGISFYTFQALSYTIDVYRGRTPPERSFFRLCLYVLFFPQLVAGPIERSFRLLPQFGAAVPFDEGRVSSGLRLVLWGLVKKVVVADHLALIVDPVYADPRSYDAGALALATYAFAFQIYADFSGYTDIAIGSARVLGFRLMENFDRPYFASSPAEFWRRWHISLSTWFRDYLYIPLGGSRGGNLRWAVALLATFLLSGLWHGARWTFVAWGAYHGLLVLLTRVPARGNPFPLPAALRVLLTFHLVLVGWVLFRAKDFPDALHILSSPFLEAVSGAQLRGAMQAVQGAGWALAVLGPAALMAADLLRGRWKLPWAPPLRWAAYAAGALFVLNARLSAENPFIYFRF